MSDLIKTLTITPPAFSQGRSNSEVFISSGHECTYCSGNGHFAPQKTGYDEYESRMCPVCNGRGRMTARIVIGWTADPPR
jgi:DnaJ-class molecular chaperone